MNRLIFLMSFITIACIAKTYPQFHEFTSINPGDSGCIDTRMVLDSTILYYWFQPPDFDGLTAWCSVYTYDIKLNKIEEINYTIDLITGALSKQYFKAYDYYDNGNISECTYYYWDSKSNDWAGFLRNVYTYDSSGNLTEVITYHWDSNTSDGADESHKYNYAYDAKGNLTEEIGFIWNSETNDWRGDERYVYAYDANGKKNIRVSYNWDSMTNNWVISLREVYAYDASGNLSMEIIYSWISISSGKVWIGEYYFYYIYDINGNLTERNRLSWDSSIKVWREDESYVYQYDANGDLTEEIGYDWDLITNGWRGNERYKYAYDASGNLSEKISYVWKSEINDWAETEKVWSFWSYPLIMHQAFYVDENCSDCTLIGSIITGSSYPRENITFNISGGNADNLFALDTVTGVILQVNPAGLDFETSSIYNLTVEAQFKDSTGIRTQNAEITIYVNNVNDNVPVVNDATFYIEEHSDPGTVIDTVIATDEDGDLNSLRYSIISGNDNHTFLIDNCSGIITVNLLAVLDYEIQNMYTLTIQVSDDIFKSEATITINVTDVPETSAGTVESSGLLKLYPNPASNVLYIEVPDNSREGFSVEMTNLAGTKVYSKSGYIEHIDISDFKNGIYFIKVNIKNTILAGKVIINSDP